MNYPLISEYIESVKLAEDNFEELNYLRPVLDAEGLPVMSSGNFAVVFKMKDERDGKLYAVRCFHRDQEGRAESYRLIEEELRDVESPYLVSFRYMDKELFVDSSQTDETEFPVLLMDWVEGITLDKYLRENLDDQYALEMLAYRFSQLAQWLIPQPFAHGDLKPDNILVREDGTLVLVDYDGMYVPAMKGQKARELGSPDFRHPLRTEDDFDEHIDDFPLVSILLSLKVISINPALLERYGATDRLLFSERDYRDIANSDVIKNIFPSYYNDINKLISVLTLYLTNDINYKIDLIKVVKIDHFLDFTDCWDALFKSDNNYVDEYGVIYSPDRKVLIQWHDLTTKNESFPISYVVQDGTEIICNEAFMYCKDLETISLPASLKIIGENVFEQTKVSNILNNSPAFEVIEDVLYSKNHEIIYYYSYNKKGVCYKVPNCVKKIVKGCFSSSLYLWIIQLNHIYYDFDDFAFSNKAISIPIGTRKYLNLGALYYSGDQYRDYFIRPNIFEGELTIIDGGVVYSADRSILYRFPYWLNQEEYRVDPKCRIIEYAAFDDSWGIDSYGQHIRFNKLKQLYLPNGLQEINDYAFVGCGHIENVTIPQSVKRIGNFVFGQCVNLMTLTFLSHIDNINEKAFHVGKTMPGSLVNPDVPYVSLQWKKNEVDIVICPRGTDNYYKRILNNMNSQVCVLSEDEEQIKIENPDHINDVNYFGLSPNQINLITSPLLKEKLKEIVYEIPQNESCSDFGLHLNKLKEILNQTVFDISKSTTRFYFRDALFGFCYMTKHYRARLVMGDCLYRSMDDAIDMLCRIYHDAKGEENCNDDLPF